MPNQNKWDNLFLSIAINVSKMSKDPSTKVGSVIVTNDNRQCSFGYNGFASGIEEKEEYWNNREIKYEMVIHAEENAILNCPFDIRGSKIYITHKPCHKCLIRLYQAGVVEVYYINDYIRSTHSQIWDLHASKFKLVKQLSITDQ